MAPKAGESRLRTIDGLRGIAAMWVVLYHLQGAMSLTFENWVHPYIQWFLWEGYLGVDIFFVLSGFVIPFSIRNADLTPGFMGRFALRRSIRLDPPYWVAIILEVTFVAIALRLGLSGAPLPSASQVLAHVFYLQNLLGLGDIVDVFWTLCFEIQFYLGLVAILVAGQAIERAAGRRWAVAVGCVVFAVMFVVSVLGRYGVAGLQIHQGFALLRWFQFFMGTLVYWVVTRKVTWHLLPASWLVLFAILIVGRESPLQSIPILTSALLWWSWERDRMSTILSGRVVQFLGVISYSLYLFHATVGWRWIRLTGIYFGSDASILIAIGAFASGCAIAVGFSWAAWRWLERPAMRLSKIVPLPRQLPDTSAGPLAETTGPSPPRSAPP